jgi:hypothetical protein
MHAALDDRMLDAEQFSDCCLHVKTPFSDQWTISNRPAAPTPPPMHMSPRHIPLCAGHRSGDGRYIRQFRWAVQYPEQRAPPE